MSKGDTQVLDFEKICRLCLMEKRSLSAIFSKKKSDSKVPLPIRIMTCASLELYEGDGLPASICGKCLLLVNQSFAFREQCEQSDTTLRQYLQEKSLNTEPDTPSTPPPPPPLPVTTLPEPTSQDEPQVPDPTTQVLVKIGSDSEEIVDSDVVVDNDCEEDEVLYEDEVVVEEEVKVEPVDPVEPGERAHVVKPVTDEEVLQLFDAQRQKVLENRKQLDSIVKLVSKSRHQSQAGTSFPIPTFDNAELIDKLTALRQLRQAGKASERVYCSKCNIFLRKSSLHQHIKFVHKRIKKYLCTECGYATYTNSILRQHHQAVHVGYTFECSECPAKFNLKKRLDKHVKKSHSGEVAAVPERRHMCQYCGMALSSSNGLSRHIRTHTQEKPYQCEFCDRRFAGRWAMVQHTRLHTGVKPYKCSYCDESFTQNCVRKTHEYKKHGNMEFQPKPKQQQPATTLPSTDV